MIQRLIPSLAALLALGLATSTAFGELGVGDKAPPLTITEWVQGDAVSFPKDLGKKVYMVEFWATWCPPCKASVPRLTKMQDRHKKDLVIVGVTAPDFRGNTPSAVRDFVKRQGSKMSYTVAIDKDMRTTDAYLTAAKVDGIPYAFLVDRSGTIAWQGSPLDPAMEDVVARVIEGKYDLAAAKAEAEAAAMVDSIAMTLRFGQFEKGRTDLVTLLKLDPSNLPGLHAMLSLYVEEFRDKAAFRSWCADHIERNRSDVRAMTRLALILCNNGDFAYRTPDLALEAGKAGYEAGEHRDLQAIIAYARAQFQIANLDRAIALQEEAVAVAEADDLTEAKDVLAFFRTCRELQTGAG